MATNNFRSYSLLTEEFFGLKFPAHRISMKSTINGKKSGQSKFFIHKFNVKETINLAAYKSAKVDQSLSLSGNLLELRKQKLDVSKN